MLALQGAFDLGLSALLDTLGTANELASTMSMPSVAFNVSLVGVRRRVHTAQGFSIPMVAWSASDSPDAVLLPALGDKMPASLAEPLTHRDVVEAGGALREWAQGGAQPAGKVVCTTNQGSLAFNVSYFNLGISESSASSSSGAGAGKVTFQPLVVHAALSSFETLFGQTVSGGHFSSCTLTTPASNGDNVQSLCSSSSSRV